MYLASKGWQGDKLGPLCSLGDHEIQVGHFYLSSGTDASNAQHNDLAPPTPTPAESRLVSSAPSAAPELESARIFSSPGEGL